jgi:Antibiotic biosynthesis monooxygenase
MVKFIEMDQTVSLFTQLEQNKVPVVLINEFDVKPDEADEFIKAWAEHSAYFKQQPGFISTQPHRGIGGSSMFENQLCSLGIYRAFQKKHLTILNPIRY